ncbi:Cytochrome c oxidase subunit 7A-related protein, mitochondrial [Operophtera brumata]|uniref:Cytochrome c oxidase subunit 7A-related protein, mitochondrial n=1 Tax=Operophtera brumata TaxID=104452 RepID=A0A0L7L1W2_OPEBR|nr:Cytochrome c oxidase subunit 7A-related protein, mitochondrial [Operophtera brumata]
MYHQLSKVTGRVVAATNLQSPLFPVVPLALQRVEQPPIQYTAALSTVAEACPAPGKRTLVPGTNIPYPGVSEKMRLQQQKFQTEDDVPIFLKGGPIDGILYRVTLALCIVGLLGVGKTVFDHAVPKK